MRVILISNYAADRQESMLRFSDVLAQHLPSHGIKTEVLQPKPTFGRFANPQSGAAKWLGYIDKFLLFPRDLKRKLGTGDRTTVLHICDHSNAIYTQYFQSAPHLVTCNDLLAIRSARGEFPENPTRWSGKRLQSMILKGLNRARRVTCISDATRQDLLRLSSLKPDQTDVTYMGLNNPYRPMPPAETTPLLSSLFALSPISYLPSPNLPPTSGLGPPIGNASLSPIYNLRSPNLPLTSVGRVPSRGVPVESTPNQVSGFRYHPSFALHVGGNQWYKNRLGVLRIYNELVQLGGDPPILVMVGKPFTEAMYHYVRDHNLQKKVIEITQAANEQLRALYSSAELLLFPSLAEGFGWPIIEAQACGCRVVTSNRAPMTEVAGDAALYIDPANEPTAARAINRLLTENETTKATRIERGRLNAQRFTTESMINKYIQIYRELLPL